MLSASLDKVITVLQASNIINLVVARTQVPELYELPSHGFEVGMVVCCTLIKPKSYQQEGHPRKTENEFNDDSPRIEWSWVQVRVQVREVSNATWLNLEKRAGSSELWIDYVVDRCSKMRPFNEAGKLWHCSLLQPVVYCWDTQKMASWIFWDCPILSESLRGDRV